MKNFIFLSAMLLCFTSCTNVLFVNPQPEGIGELTEIPENLQGIYAFTDSIIVTSNTIGEDTLGKSLIVKKRGNFYYLNYLEDSVYSLTVVKVVKCLSFEDFEVFHSLNYQLSQSLIYVLNNRSPLWCLLLSLYGTDGGRLQKKRLLQLFFSDFWSQN